MLKKFNFKDVEIFVYSQEENEKMVLKQSETKVPLSKLDDGCNAIINFSYFTSDYPIGRNQGEKFNNFQDQDDMIDFILLKDGSYRINDFNSWDYIDNYQVGVSPACVLIKDGKGVEILSTAIKDVKQKLTLKNPQTAIFKCQDKWHFLVTHGRSYKMITGYEVREFVREFFPEAEVLMLADGGGSSEMIVDGKIINYQERGERAMFNGLAFVSPKKTIEIDEKKTVLMAHLSQMPSLKVGDKLYYGDYIGEMGDTGKSYGIHLHIAVLDGVLTKPLTLDKLTYGTDYMANADENYKELDYFKSGDDLFINDGIHREAYKTMGFFEKDKTTYYNHCAFDLCAKKRGFNRYPLIHWNRSYIGTVVGVGFSEGYYGYYILIAYGNHKGERPKEVKEEVKKDDEKENLKKEVENLKKESKSKDEILIEKVKEIEKIKQENNFLKGLISKIKDLLETILNLIKGE